MHYYIYQITCLINNKIYIGKHKTSNLEDGYFGSGKYLKRAITKYGKENFTKEILFEFNSEEEINAKEKELVTEEFCLRKDTYNLCVGGLGGFSYINREGLRAKRTEATRAKLSSSLKAWHAKNPKQRKPVLLKGTGNGHKGMIWIYNPKINERSKINPNIKDIPEGWKKGAKAKEVKNAAIILKEKRRLEAVSRYNAFKESGLSLTKFAKSIGVSQPNLSKLWKSYNFNGAGAGP